MSFSWARLGRGEGAGDYYTAELEKALAEQGAASSDGYYTASGEMAGQWWTLKSTIIKDGSAVRAETFKALLAGYDPETGEALCRKPGDKHLAGYDMTLSAPKSVSVLWASADDDLKAKIEAAQTKAVTSAYEFAAEQGCFVTRAGKDGVRKLKAEDVMIARFRHHTSRAGDPQIHDHGVIINLAVGPDGKTRALETNEIMKFQGAIAAAYRVTLASELQELGFEVEKDGRNFEVSGVAKPIRDVLSKRRTEIEDAAREHGISTARDRHRTRKVATDTRAAKDKDLTPAELDRRWTGEMERAGYSKASIITAARVMAADAPPRRPEEVVTAALKEATETQSVVEERHLWRLVLEHGQGVIKLSDAADLIDQAARDGQIVRIGEGADKRPVYSTPEIIEKERQMLADAIAERPVCEFDSEAVEAAILETGVDAAQAKMVRHLAAGGAVVVGEGSAGAGKTRASATIVRAAEASGMRVRGFAPSWKAAGALRADSQLDETAAVQGFLNRLDEGAEKLNDRDCLLVDEAGMVSLSDMARLMRHARAAGARVILLGDRRQLEAIGAGSPMAVIARELGGDRLTTIRRQQDTYNADGTIAVSRQWMRDCSELLAEGKGDEALRRYDAQGHVTWSATRDEVIEKLTEDWTAHVAEHPDETRMVITPRNADVRDLNQLLREGYRAAGKLSGDEVVIEAIDRSGFARDLALAAGDRIAIGDGVADLDLDTSDLATVVAVRRVKGDVELTLAMDKDQVRGKPQQTRKMMLSKMVGWRDPSDTDRRPRMQHAYAGTLYLSQGQSIGKVFVANLQGLDMRSLYVAMTRHWRDVQLYVDCERVEDILYGRMVPGDITPEPTLDDIKKVIQTEALRETHKSNVSDFVEDRAAWIAIGELVLKGEGPQTTPTPGHDTAVPAFLSNARKAELAKRGYSQDQIFTMSPREAHAIITEDRYAPRSPAEGRHPLVTEWTAAAHDAAELDAMIGDGPASDQLLAEREAARQHRDAVALKLQAQPDRAAIAESMTAVDRAGVRSALLRLRAEAKGAAVAEPAAGAPAESREDAFGEHRLASEFYQALRQVDDLNDRLAQTRNPDGTLNQAVVQRRKEAGQALDAVCLKIDESSDQDRITASLGSGSMAVVRESVRRQRAAAGTAERMDARSAAAAAGVLSAAERHVVAARGLPPNTASRDDVRAMTTGTPELQRMATAEIKERVTAAENNLPLDKEFRRAAAIVADLNDRLVQTRNADGTLDQAVVQRRKEAGRALDAVCLKIDESSDQDRIAASLGSGSMAVVRESVRRQRAAAGTAEQQRPATEYVKARVAAAANSHPLLQEFWAAKEHIDNIDSRCDGYRECGDEIPQELIAQKTEATRSLDSISLKLVSDPDRLTLATAISADDKFVVRDSVARQIGISIHTAYDDLYGPVQEHLKQLSPRQEQQHGKSSRSGEFRKSTIQSTASSQPRAESLARPHPPASTLDGVRSLPGLCVDGGSGQSEVLLSRGPRVQLDDRKPNDSVRLRRAGNAAVDSAPKTWAEYSAWWQAIAEGFQNQEDERKAEAKAKVYRDKLRAAEVKAQPPKTIARPVSDPAELDRFAREIDLRRFLEARGYKAVEGRDNYGLRMVRGEWKKDAAGKISATDQVMVAFKAGKWVYTDPKNSADAGSIIRYVQTRDRLNLGQTRKALRQYLAGGAAETPAAADRRREIEAQRTAKAAGDLAASQAQARARFAATPRAKTSDYLKARGLPAKLAGEIPDIRVGKNGVLCFGHRDTAGVLTGYEIKGRGIGGENISRFSAGGNRALFQVGPRAEFRRLVVCEAAIDALSKRQIDGAPTDSMYVSMGGRPSAAVKAQLAELVRQHPDATVEIALDRDAGGVEMTAGLVGMLQQMRGAGQGNGWQTYCAQVAGQAEAIGLLPEMAAGERKTWEAIQAVRNQQGALPAGVSIAVPGQGKDWNDQIRGVGWSPSTATAEAAERAAAVEEAADALEMEMVQSQSRGFTM